MLDIKGYILNPCCPKEKNLVYKGTHGSTSCRCPRCGKFIKYNYDTMEACVITAVKNATYR